MGDVQRIMYVHVPPPGTRCSLTVRLRLRGHAAVECEHPLGSPPRGLARVGVVLSALLCMQGAIWAKPTWGVWWDWDPRLTTTAVLVFAFGGILALRQFVDDP
jgi:heme exporter protein C